MNASLHVIAPKISRYIWALACYIGQWSLLILAIQGKHWAWNVFAFLMWICTIAAVLAVVVVTKEERPFPPRAFGSVLPALSDLGIALTCAAIGHFGYAVLSIIQIIFEAAAYKADFTKAGTA